MIALRDSTFSALVLILFSSPSFGSQKAEAQHGVKSEHDSVFPGAYDLPLPTRAQLQISARTGRELSTPEAAHAAGYRRIAPPSIPDLNPVVGEHWINQRYLRVSALAPERPAYLIFYPLNGEQTPVGLAYGMAQPTGAPPPLGFEGEFDK